MSGLHFWEHLLLDTGLGASWGWLMRRSSHTALQFSAWLVWLFAVLSLDLLWPF